MYILSSVEAGWTAGANAVGSEALDGFLFDILVCDEVVEVVGGKVRDCAAI